MLIHLFCFSSRPLTNLKLTYLKIIIIHDHRISIGISVIWALTLLKIISHHTVILWVLLIISDPLWLNTFEAGRIILCSFWYCTTLFTDVSCGFFFWSLVSSEWWKLDFCFFLLFLNGLWFLNLRSVDGASMSWITWSGSLSASWSWASWNHWKIDFLPMNLLLLCSYSLLTDGPLIIGNSLTLQFKSSLFRCLNSKHRTTKESWLLFLKIVFWHFCLLVTHI